LFTASCSKKSIPENIGNRRGVRAVVASYGQYAIRDGPSYTDTFRFVVTIRNFRQGLLQLGIERGLKCRIQGNQNLMCRCGCSCVLGSTSWHAGVRHVRTNLSIRVTLCAFILDYSVKSP
jgi:hypothetical protein